MKKYISVAVLSAIFSVFVYSHAAPQKKSPGAELFTPTRIDWLATTCQANLREEMTSDRPYSVDITYRDAETVLIYVRYFANVDRTLMNKDIDTARSVIHITARSYGWDEWVKIKEDVELAKSTK
jgi:hypothetical protein